MLFHRFSLHIAFIFSTSSPRHISVPSLFVSRSFMVFHRFSTRLHSYFRVSSLFVYDCARRLLSNQTLFVCHHFPSHIGPRCPQALSSIHFQFSCCFSPFLIPHVSDPPCISAITCVQSHVLLHIFPHIASLSFFPVFFIVVLFLITICMVGFFVSVCTLSSRAFWGNVGEGGCAYLNPGIQESRPFSAIFEP